MEEGENIRFKHLVEMLYLLQSRGRFWSHIKKGEQFICRHRLEVSDYGSTMLLSRVELIAQTLDMNFFGFVKKGKVGTSNNNDSPPLWENFITESDLWYLFAQHAVLYAPYMIFSCFGSTILLQPSQSFRFCCFNSICFVFTKEWEPLAWIDDVIFFQPDFTHTVDVGSSVRWACPEGLKFAHNIFLRYAADSKSCGLTIHGMSVSILKQTRVWPGVPHPGKQGWN